MSDKRARLPNRRLSLGIELEWPPNSGKTWQIQVGFDRHNRVREVFCDGPKIGTDMEAILDDACVLASIGLQFGGSIGQLAHAVSRESIEPGASVASIVGAVIEAAARLERHVHEGGAPEADCPRAMAIASAIVASRRAPRPRKRKKRGARAETPAGGGVGGAAGDGGGHSK